MKGFKRRAALPVWKVIILIFVGFIGIAGVTALVLYFMGTFDEKKVVPADLAFTQTVDGQGVYEDGIFKLSDDSKLTIVTTTEDVTEKKVTLTLKNSIWTRSGFTSDGVIIIPTEVEVNQPFKVELVKRNNVDVGADWVVGSVDGYSYITAKSQNILLPSKSATIAVDTPVSQLNLVVGNGSTLQTESVQNVVVGSAFKIEAIFTPSNSKYLFNDETTSKKVFYQVLGSDGVSYISYDEKTDTFYANEISSGKYSIVNAYAFSNSYFEKNYFQQYPEATTDEVIAFLQAEENAKMAVSATVNIKVLDIEVKDVTIDANGQTAEVYVDKYFTLSTNSTEKPNDMSLGVSIFDSGNALAPTLLGRVGIKIPKDQPNFSIFGGSLMKVTTTEAGTTIEEEVFNPDYNYANAATNVDYYVLPYTGSNIDYNNYYWSFSSNQTLQAFKLYLNFFYKDEGGQWQAFFDEESENSINVNVNESDNSVSLTAESLDLVINYDDAGNTIPAELSLSAELGANNVYTKVVYFLYDNTRDGTVNVRDIFDCSEGVDYSKDYKGQTLNISGINQKESYTLYELIGTRLIANKSYTGSVVLIAAVVRTDANGTVLLDAAGNYQIVCLSGAKAVNVDSTLSISKMTPTFSFIEGVEQNADNNQYYLPSINRNEDGSVKDMVSFTLKLSSEDISKDVEKLMTAYGTSLKVVCCDKDGNEYQDQYLTLHNFSEVADQRTANTATFVGTFAIEEEFFSAGVSSVDLGKAISFKLVYDDGKEVREKLVGMDEPATDGIVDCFYVYYQQPVAMTATYQGRADISVSNPVEVEISSGANGLTIKWGQVGITGENYDAIISGLNELLTFKLVDQFGKTIKDVDGVYSVSFVEIRNDSNYVLTFNETQTKIADFVSTNGKTVSTSLKVFVVDKKNDNKRVMAVENGIITDVEMQSDLILFNVSSEGVEEVWFDNSTDIDNVEEDRFEQSTQSLTEISTRKMVSTDDAISLTSLFKVYTTGSAEPNTDYKIYFDGTWLQNFQGTSGVSLKKMLQLQLWGETTFEGSEEVRSNISDYQGVAISAIKANAPFGEETTLVFRVISNNNLYSITLRLTLYSDIEISKSFEDYQREYQDYLATTTTGAISIFADETYNLDTYLSFSSSKYSWGKALTAPGVELGSDVNGVFYEQSGVATLNTNADEGIVSLKVSAVKQYTTITITIYYGVRSDYAFSAQIALYVNPNIVVVEKVDRLDNLPSLDLETIKESNISDYYSVFKATDYKNGVETAVTIENVELSAQSLYYKNKDSENGFITIENGGVFRFVTGKDVDILQSYTQEFNIYSSSDALLDAVKVRVAQDGTSEIVSYDSTNRITIQFSVCYNSLGVEGLVQEIFPQATIITYEGENRLLLLAGEAYAVSGGFTIGEVTGDYIYKNAASTQLTTRIPTFENSQNSVNVYSSVDDGQNTLQINIKLGVTVSNLGKELVYYSNSKNAFNTYEKVEYVKTSDKAVNSLKTYYQLSNGKYVEIENPVAEYLTSYYEKQITYIDFDKLVSSTYTSLEENGVYEVLKAGKTYTILHDISKEYTATQDTEIVEGKTYYQNIDGIYTVEEKPDVGNIGNYYEKKAAEQGFYYDKQLLEANGATRDIAVEIVSTDVLGYVEGLATYENGILTINNLDKAYENSAFIVLKVTFSTRGANVSSYSWFYRIKVTPNFEIGKVNYPYNNGQDSEISGEFLDTSSAYYDSETLTYTIDLAEKYNTTNSSYYRGSRFDDIEWIEMPTGVITENYRVVSISSNGVSATFEGEKLKLAYSDASYEATAITVKIEKYWCVDNIEAIGSAMEYIFKLNQARTYTTSLYEEKVSDATKDNAYVYRKVQNADGTYDVEIVAGENETTLIPIVNISDASIETSASFDTYIKGDLLELLDALKFKKVWVASGTEVSYSIDGESRVHTLSEDVNLVDGEDWAYADFGTNDEGEVTVTIKGSTNGNAAGGETIEGETGDGETGGDETNESAASNSYVIKDSKLWFTTTINGEKYSVGASLEDVIVEFLDKTPLDYYETEDTERVTSKTYYVYENGEYKKAEFSDTTDESGEVTYEGFKENIIYFEKYRETYDAVTICTKENISKNSAFELGVYTDEKVVFKVNLSVKSYFIWTVKETTFDSGKTITFGDIISDIESKSEENAIKSISMKLTNGADVYREEYVAVEHSSMEANKTYYVVVSGKYQEVKFTEETIGQIGDDVYYEKIFSLTNADITKIEGAILADDKTGDAPDGLDLSTLTVEIAPLVSNIVLDFEVEITATSGFTYTFELSLNVNKCFDESLTRQVQDNSYRFSKVPFNVEIADGTVKPADGTGTFVNLQKSENTTYEFVAGDGYEIVEESIGEGETTTLQTQKIMITPDNVAETTEGVIKTLYLVGKFGGKEILKFKVNYRYSVKPNVTITANYPIPDGDEKNPSTTEYISATEATTEEGQKISQGFENFLGSAATFASNSRVVVENVEELKGEQIAQNWDVSISSISSNIVVYYGLGDDLGYLKSINSDSVDKVILKDSDSESSKINVKFLMTNTASNGEVVFDIRVNEVWAQYKVTIISNPIVKVSTNAPNYTQNRETVFAEDLAGYEELELFKQDRLLNYTFNSSVVTGTNYYVRLAGSTENKIVPITVTTRGVAVNFDLGKSYAGYEYDGTFSTLEAAQNNDTTYKVSDDSQIYTSAPKITSRIVVTYYDGKQIKLDEKNYILLSSDELSSDETEEKADAVVLTTADYHKERTFTISVKVGETTIETSWQYNLYLETEFGVTQNADSADVVSYKEINAGDEKSLLDEVDFGVYNTRTGNKFSNSGSANTDSFANSGGAVDLQIYGFSNLKILANGDELQKTAFQIHQDLEDGKLFSENGIIYTTGLNPRYREGGLNTDDGSIDQNYITISDVVENGKKVDFSIRARGASNDGNFVMMKLSYTVTFGTSTDGTSTEPIRVAHNLLFKVLPNAEISFLARAGSTATVRASDEVVNGQTYASNQDSEFTMQDGYVDSTLNNKNAFYLWKGDSVSLSAIQAYLHGNRTLNNANTFTYTYTKNAESGYNDHGVTLDTENMWSENSNTYTSNSGLTTALTFQINELKLGSRKFFVTAVDSFGFKIKFYFKLSATEDPQIAGATKNELVEGSSVVIGAQYLPVSPTIVPNTEGDGTEYRQLLGSITYKKIDNSDDYANIISNIPADNLTKLILSAQTTEFGTVISTFTSEGDSKNNIRKWETEKVENSNPVSYITSISIWGTDYNDWALITGGVAQKTNPDSSATDKPYLYLEQSNLLGATISIYGVFNKTSETTSASDYPTFTNLMYEDEEISQEYLTSTGYESPNLTVVTAGENGDSTTNTNDDKTLVILRGITAYAFPTTGESAVNAINTDVAKSYTSRINDIKVSKVEYFYKGVSLGQSLITSRTETKAGKGNPISLITSGNYKYYNNDVIDGISYEQDSYDFVVPVIDGIYFGTGTSLPNVEMRITVKDGANNEATLSYYVTITRKATSPVFNTNVADNNTVTKSSNATVYNDTLEVVLEKGASVKFAITTSAPDEAPQEGLITLTNTNDFAITKYVGISANVVNLEHNFKKRQTTFHSGSTSPTDIGPTSFFVSVLEQSESANVKFRYNGSDITVDNEKTYYIYTLTKDVTLVADKEYFTKGENGTYTKVTSPTADELSSYYEQIFSYVLTEDENILDEKTYYTKADDGTYTEVTNPTTENLSSYYEQKSYYGTNGTSIGTYENGITLHINDYSELSSITSSKTETLYFVFEGEGYSSNTTQTIYETYQMVQTFKVFPLYEKVESTSVDTSGNIEFKVNNYYKAENGDGDFYYIIDKAKWGYPLNLKSNSALTSESDKLSQRDSYYFYYEINQDVVGGAGGAFIDEMGTITTANGFNLQDSTITVNVYMKVSGQNGFFNAESTKFKLCTFRMMLSEDESTYWNPYYQNYVLTKDSNIVDGKTYYTKADDGIYTKVTNPTTENLSSYYEASYYEERLRYGGKLIFSVPEGYELYYTDDGPAISDPGNPTDGGKDEEEKDTFINFENTTFACEVGDTLDFHALLDDSMINSDNEPCQNINYHIVSDIVGEVENIIYYNNLNSWTVSTGGTHTITLIVTYRTSIEVSQNRIRYGKITLTIMAYDVTTREDKVVMLTAGSNYEFNVDASGVVYKLNADNSIKEADKNTSGEYLWTAPSKTGIYYQSFVIKDSNGDTKVQSYTFYVVNETAEAKTVVLTESSNFTLSKLYSTENGNYSFYKVGGSFGNNSDHSTSGNEIRPIVIENQFTNSANSSLQNHYIVCDPNGEYFMLTVTYKFVSSASPTKEYIFVKQETPLADAVKSQVAKDLKLNEADLTVEEYNSNGVIGNTIVNASDDALEYKIEGLNYLVTYKKTDGSVVYYRYTFTFFTYKKEAAVEVTSTSSYPSLTSFNKAVIDGLNNVNEEGDNDGIPDNASVMYYVLTDGVLRPTTTIDLSAVEEGGSLAVQYFIQVSTTTTDEEGSVKTSVNWYLVNLTFKQQSS